MAPKARDPSKEIKLHRIFPLTESWSNPRLHTLHLELTGQLLRKTLARRDYNRAFKLYSILSKNLKMGEEFVWKIGCELLMQKEEYEPLCLRFLQLLFAKSKKCKESILVETALYQLRFGKPEDAHTTLEPYINMYPYNENPLLLGYAGVVEFTLWNKTIRAKYFDGQGGDQNPDLNREVDIGDEAESRWLDEDDADDDDTNENSSARQWRSRISRHGNAAANLLEQALKMDPKNDMFLNYLVRLKCGKITMEGLGSKSISRRRRMAIHEMKGYLKRFYNSNNSSILSLLLLAALENREKQQTLELILSQDPAADSELYVRPLLKIFKRDIPPDQKDIISNIESRNFERGKHNNREPDHRVIHSWMHKNKPLHSKTVTPVPQLLRILKNHQPGLKHIRPILKILLMRAEFGTMAAWEEEEIIRICDLFCFCSTFCRRAEIWEDVFKKPENISSFDQLPEKYQPPWYSKLALILSRKDE